MEIKTNKMNNKNVNIENGDIVNGDKITENRRPGKAAGAKSEGRQAGLV